MSKVTRRRWKTANGKVRETWAVDLTDRTGSRHRKSFRTKREAERYLVTAMSRIEAAPKFAAGERVTVKMLADDWIAVANARVSRGELEKSTVREYQRVVDKVVAEDRQLADLTLGGFTRGEVKQFLDRLAEGGRSAAMIRKVRVVLGLIAQHGMDCEYMAVNPVSGVKLSGGRRGKPKLVVPSHAAVAALLDKAPTSKARALVGLAALAGLRASEALGLPWGAVDLTTGWLEVRQRLDGYGVIGAPKSEAGYRRVPLSPRLAAILKELRGARVPTADALVIGKGGYIGEWQNLSARVWRPLLAAAGLSLRFHDLRHFSASAWLAEGVAITTVSEWLGHSSPAVTLGVYSHMMPGGKDHLKLKAIDKKLTANNVTRLAHGS